MRVLLVEDNPGDVRLIRELLAEVGSEVQLSCADRLSAGIAGVLEDSFDAVLLDLGLPDSAGLDTLESLLDAVGSVPVVVMTGLADEEMGVRAVQAGAQDYLVKGQVDGPLLTHALRYAVERGKAEEELRLTTESLRAVIEASPAAIYLLDVGGHIRMWNPAAERMFGWSEDEVLARRPPSVPAESTDEFLLTLRDVLDSGAITGLETMRLRKDGARIDVDLSAAAVRDSRGAVRGVMVVATDVSARRTAEQERDRLFMAVEQAGEVVVVTNRDHTISYVNPAFERVTGYSRDEVLGSTPRILSSGRHDAAFYRNLREAIHRGDTWQGRFVNRKKDGSLYEEEASISPVRDETGGIISFVAVKRDVTAQRATEEQLRQSQKMEAVGRLAGGIAHDFNNLLTVIAGYAELLAARTDLPEDVSADLGEVQRAAERGRALTRRLLAFSRRDAPEPQVVDVNALVEGMRQLVHRLVLEDIALTFEVGAGMNAVWADPGQIEQILMNLVVNARDAVSGGGSIRLSTGSLVSTERIPWLGGELPAGEYASITVQDTGSGMDTETLAHAFEPFFSTKPPERGTGLGLSTVYAILDNWHSGIQVTSQPGRGSTFHVLIPASSDSPEVRSATGTPPAAEYSAVTKTILVVEDEDTVRRLTVRALRDLGYATLEASSGSEAIRVMAGAESDVALVVTDMVMPGMGGEALAETLRRRYPDLKVLFTSGYSAASHHGGAGSPERPFLEKPFTLEELASKVRAVLRSA